MPREKNQLLRPVCLFWGGELGRREWRVCTSFTAQHLQVNTMWSSLNRGNLNLRWCLLELLYNAPRSESEAEPSTISISSLSQFFFHLKTREGYWTSSFYATFWLFMSFGGLCRWISLRLGPICVNHLLWFSPKNFSLTFKTGNFEEKNVCKNSLLKRTLRI